MAHGLAQLPPPPLFLDGRRAKGSVSKAAEKLRLSQPTVSAQVRMLEKSLGERLFVKTGPNAGAHRRRPRRVPLRRRDLRHRPRAARDAQGPAAGRAMQLTVGVANAVPKLVVYRLLRPAHRAARAGAPRVPRGQRRAARSPSSATLRAGRRHHRRAGAAVPAGEGVQPPARRIGHRVLRAGAAGGPAEAPLSRIAATMRRCCCRPRNSPLRRGARGVVRARQALRPRVVGEFEDSALMKVFGQAAGLRVPGTGGDRAPT